MSQLCRKNNFVVNTRGNQEIVTKLVKTLIFPLILFVVNTRGGQEILAKLVKTLIFPLIQWKYYILLEYEKLECTRKI